MGWRRRPYRQAPQPWARLLEIDYRLARQEPDRVWADLQSTHPLPDPQARAYLQLLQATSLVDRGDYEAARRLLRDLAPDSPLLRLRASELKILTATADLADEAQAWLLELPETPWTLFVRLRLLTRRADRDKRWGEALLHQGEQTRLALETKSPQLVFWSQLMEASLLRRARPAQSLALVEDCLRRLQGTDFDSEPERNLLRGLLSTGAIDQTAGNLMALRGRLLDVSPPGRTRWRLAGEHEVLPGSVNRGQLLAESLRQAEAVGDAQMAAWLCLCHVERVFSAERDPEPFLRRALGHLESLPVLYPGKSEPFDLTIADLQDRLESAPAGAGLDRQLEAVLRAAYDREQRAELPDLVEGFLDLMSGSALTQKSPGGLLTRAVTLLNLAASNNREWEPDSLSMAPLREANPMSEMVARKLNARQALVTALLSEPADSAWQVQRKAQFLLLLGRHREARRWLRQLELDHASAPAVTVEARCLMLRSLARTQELEQGLETLELLRQQLMSEPLTEGYAAQNRTLVAEEALVLTERYEQAAALASKASPLRELLWSQPEAPTVWLLTPRPLDGVPWPLLTSPECRLRWTDGAVGPAMGANVASAPLLAGGHPDLPGSTSELKAIQRLWPTARKWLPGQGFAGLASQARQATLVHLSGHGRGVEGRYGAEIDLGPLRVTVDELFELRLERFPLVTLATCDGGLDQSLPDGRSFSMITPLRSSGAGGVLASLWTLDDERSARVFPALYARIDRGATPSEALAALTRELRQSEPPYVWAGLKLVESLPDFGNLE